MSPLHPSPKVKSMLSILEDAQEDEDGSVSQEKSHHKRRWKDSSQDGKDRGVGRGRQKQDDARRPAKNLQKNEQNEKELKPRKKDEKKGKDERIKRKRKDLYWNPGYEIKTKEEDIKEEKSRKASHRNDSEKDQAHPDHLDDGGAPVKPALPLDGRIVEIGELNQEVTPFSLNNSGLIR